MYSKPNNELRRNCMHHLSKKFTLFFLYSWLIPYSNFKHTFSKISTMYM